MFLFCHSKARDLVPSEPAFSYAELVRSCHACATVHKTKWVSSFCLRISKLLNVFMTILLVSLEIENFFLGDSSNVILKCIRR